ncbi:hypothetical protein V8E55_009663 [Tylopilus felleus]
MKQQDCTLCEAFEVFPSEYDLEPEPETREFSYPGSTVEMPSEVFDDGNFQSEFSKFLSQDKPFDSAPSNDPQYIYALLSDILQRAGRAADVPRLNKRNVPLSETDGDSRTADVSRITKRIRGHGRARVGDWRRSLLWLLIRVAIHMSINRSLARSSYKQFMLFFMCTLAMDESNTSLFSDLLHLMSSTILRRLRKLGSSTPYPLSEMALKTSTCLQEILDSRWKQLDEDSRRSPFQNPSQDELIRDTKLSLSNSREYIQDALANHGQESIRTPFRPNHRRRGTIEDFLSLNETFFDKAYGADPDVTLYDVERSVEDDIDDWLACVRDVDEACAQLELLMDKYTRNACPSSDHNPERISVMFLTVIELYVALDKLVVKEIPMLADYPPPFPMSLLENMLLRKRTSLHRLSCAYQYLSVRHSQSRLECFAFSNEFTEDSLAVRYYDQSSDLQQLRARIEEDAMENVGRRSRFHHRCAGLMHS